MAFSDEFLSELNSRNDIFELVSNYVRLKNNGSRFVGLCPFHNEKTPSFVVYPESQSFYCFGCGAGGDIITFVKRIENLDYVDAVKFLAERAGMSLPQDGYDDSLHKQKLRILEANREAARYFHNMLMSDGGNAGIDYLKKRGLTRSTIRKFGLGFAPDNWHGLHHYLRGKGFSDNDLVLANLVRSKDKNVYDAFRNKVMFPIIDIRGNVIAFGGRVLDDSKPKYINTSDTPVYKKSEGVFSLNLAKNNNDGQLIIVEGYMDVISLYQAGITNAIACLGTALTVQQAKLISKYASKEIVLSYDNDEAGRTATDRAIRIFNRENVSVRVARLSGGKDPDEIVKKYGVERLKGMFKGAENDTEYRLLIEKDKFDTRTDAGKVGYLNEAVKVLASISSPIERDIYTSKISSELEVDKSAVELQINRSLRAKKKNEGKKLFENIRNEMSGRNDSLNPEKSKFLRGTKAEERLISLLMNNPDYLVHIEKKLTYENFVTDFNSRMFKMITERIKNGRSINISNLSEGLTDEEISYLANLSAVSEYNANTLEECMECVDTILEEHKKRFKKKPQELTDEEWRRAFNIKNR